MQKRDNSFIQYSFKDDYLDKCQKEKTECSSQDIKQKINIDFSSPQYKVAFDYDSKTNSYKRSIAGKVQLDRDSNKQISVKNLIVMYVNKTPTVTRINEQGLNMDTIGSGKAKVFIDGKVVEGSWKKDNTNSREIFIDVNGSQIIFNRGQFWVCVVSPDTNVSVE